MNLLHRPRIRYTFDDFALVKDGEKADLIDGVIYMASPDNTDANELNCWLVTVLNNFLYRTNLGKVYCSRVAFRLDKTNAPEPDIGFVKKSRLRQVLRGRVEGRPDAAIEIVSPESVERDYHLKRNQFEAFRVPEYWLIDEIKKKVLLLRLDKAGQFQEVPAKNGILRSKVIRGFWLREDWLWQSPLPDPMKIAQSILKGNPFGRRRKS